MEEEFRPVDYWEMRYAVESGRRGAGHLSYEEGYNSWLYRRKGEVLAPVLARITAPCRALDVGSGTGWVMDQLLAAGASPVDGVDISPTAVERLRRRLPTPEIHQHTLGHGPLPLADASYDLITLIDVAFHITEDDRFDAAIADLARVLAPGGVLIVTDRLGAHTSTPAPHVRFRPLAQWEGAAHATGLRVTSTVPLYSWLSRDVRDSRLRHLPDGLRGAIEYLGERLAPRPAHLRLATLAHAS